jgi:hypothetical protein
MQGKNSEINFVVMENVFHPEVPVDEQYDLKVRTLSILAITCPAAVLVHERCSNRVTCSRLSCAKGSTIDRLVAVEEGKFNPSIALKDMNFKRQLRIGGSLKALLMEQVEKDTRVRTPSLDCSPCIFLFQNARLTLCSPVQWMANLNICDYSFLVGIHSLQDDDSMVIKSPGVRR